MAIPKLTTKQSKFIALYDGNGAKTAKLAGYKGSEHTLKQVASENLAKPYIAEAIRKRQEKELAPMIATRQQRQAFWTKVLNTKTVSMANRLRASELLGKSEADFTDKTQVSGPDGGPQVIAYIPDNGRKVIEDDAEGTE